MKNTVFIVSDLPGETAGFAAQELAAYLIRAGALACCVKKAEPESFLTTIKLEIWEDVSEIEDAAYDDAYRIQVRDLQGTICGSNERSILLGCYRFLRELGFAFLRPDAQGERIPDRIRPHEICIAEHARYRHRGICIEGAVSFENVTALIRWMPKAGLNTYFTQFLTPYEFFRTWYEHIHNPLWTQGKVPSPEQVDLYIEEVLVPELQKRGMIWQAAGHGFHTETLGVRGLGWNELEDTRGLKTEWIAQTGGKRELFHGIPMNTNLCYSNPEVREAFTDRVQEFLETHAGVDLLHIWLADEGNNSCECEECCRKLPSDWYVELLNQIDERLTCIGNPVKIVFLGYFDLLWPPKEMKLNNEKRFVFMFAPITRSYREPLPVSDGGALAEYRRNHARFPVSAEENMRYARAWKTYFPGESFVYDYHYMWNHFQDWGDYESAKILYEDIGRLEDNGFQGYISCQQTRVFAPTGLGMYVLGHSLWGDARTFEEMAEEYFSCMYGEQAKDVRSYARELSRLSYSLQPEAYSELPEHTLAGHMDMAVSLLDQMIPVFQESLEMRSSADQIRWKYLINAAKAAKMYCYMLKYKRLCMEQEALEAYEKLKEELCSTEGDWQEGFDLYWFIKKYDTLLLR